MPIRGLCNTALKEDWLWQMCFNNAARGNAEAGLVHWLIIGSIVLGLLCGALYVP